MSVACVVQQWIQQEFLWVGPDVGKVHNDAKLKVRVDMSNKLELL